ncbi:MAG: hypothetical protein IIU01_04045 [Oscillospiraceae bacterium]|nr:hypothetical protein [Oscillospiraceae bacterium]
MNKELLFDSFSDLDENLLARSETAKTHIPWHRWAALAACFVLVAALAVPAITGHLPRAEQAEQLKPETAEHNEATHLPSNTPDAAESNDPIQLPANSPNAMLPNNGINIPADGTQEDARYVESKQMISHYDIGNMDACYAVPQNGEVNFSMPLRAAMEAYGDSVRYRVVVDLFRDESQLPPDGADAKNEGARLAALGYITAFETYTDNGSSQTWFTLHATYDQLADFAVAGEYGYMFFLYGERVPGGDTEYPAVIFNAGEVTESTAACPAAPQSETLSAEQAYADADFGGYLCQTPQGFTAENFRRTDGRLMAYFSRGYDYVEWNATRCTEADKARIVSLDHPEDYDLSLYSIPFAESVPADKRQIVDEPIFRAEELTLDAVRARTLTVADAGDSAGARMSFAVLFGGDILVRISTKGVSPEWVFEQLSAMR